MSPGTGACLVAMPSLTNLAARTVACYQVISVADGSITALNLQQQVAAGGGRSQGIFDPTSGYSCRAACMT